MNQLLKLANKYKEKIIENRRYLHANPELGLYLPISSAYIKQELENIGLEPKQCGIISEEMQQDLSRAGYPEQPASTGIVATIGQGEPCILLRADFDALPVEEDTGLDFASTNGNMHACGHDAHAAMLLGAARILKELEDELKGTVKLVFQTGEEWGSGATRMIEDGVLENPKVDRAFAIHIDPLLDVGKVNYSFGTASGSIDHFYLDIMGQGGHSSRPQHCVDPNFIAVQVINAFYSLIGREANPNAPASIAITCINGGNSVNVIPDKTQVLGSMRTLDIETRERLAPRLDELVDSIVKQWGGSYNFTHLAMPSTYTDRDFTLEILPAIEAILEEKNVKQSTPFEGAEDFGFFTKEVPGALIWLGVGHKDNASLHSPKMILDEEALCLGAAIHVAVALEFFKNN